MTAASTNRKQIIDNRKTEQLFNRLRVSAVATVIVAFTIVAVIRPYADETMTTTWLVLIMLVSIWRFWVALRYQQASKQERELPGWSTRFRTGVYLAAAGWGLAVWMCYPHGHVQYEVLLLLGIASVAGTAIAVLSFDKTLMTVFVSTILFSLEARLLTSDGELALEMSLFNLWFYIFLLKGGSDISDSYHEMLSLRQDAEEHNTALLTAAEQVARIGYWKWNPDLNELELSSNLMAMAGSSISRVSLQNYLNYVHDNDRDRLQSSIESVLETGEESIVEYRMLSVKAGGWIVMNQVAKTLEDSNQGRLVLGTVQDISDIKSAEQRIFDMAYFDDLTGLANRGHFQQQLIERIKQADRNEGQVALLYLDLDGFNKINDTFGHEKGDEYLKAFTELLKQTFREEDFIARLGGDEFCVIQSGLKSGVEAGTSAERCLMLKDRLITVEGREVSPRMSVGIALYPQDGEDVDSLLKAADAAMYSAKRKGKQRFEFYDEKMTEDAATRLELDSDLKKALVNKEFKLLYQPKMSLHSGRMMGVEALIRWNHPHRGVVPPDEFISAAERNGLINEIGEWVLIEACKQQKLWIDQGYNLEMAVNISSSHFSSEKFVEYIRKMKQSDDLPASALEVEITESLTRDPLRHIEISQQLREMGIKVAIDDFGTGYSSLSVLRELKADTLKIDRAFIQHLPDDQTSALLVRAITTMAIGLGYDVVAEGVETEEQAHFLREMGNPYVQGYLYSRPVEADQIPELIEDFMRSNPEPAPEEALSTDYQTVTIELPIIPS